MQIKYVVFLLSSIVCSLARAEFICSASNDGYPFLSDGLIFSKKVSGLGAQGTSVGHQLLHDSELFSFWLVAGTLISSQQEPAKLVDFYVEIHDKTKSRIVRAKSGKASDEQVAHLELIEYPKDSFLYRGILLFRCTKHFFS